jgi:hypothetical protein
MGSYSEAPVVVNDGGQRGFSGNSFFRCNNGHRQQHSESGRPPAPFCSTLLGKSLDAFSVPSMLFRVGVVEGCRASAPKGVLNGRARAAGVIGGSAAAGS